MKNAAETNRPPDPRFQKLDPEIEEEIVRFSRSLKTLSIATFSAGSAGETPLPEASYAPFVRCGGEALHICVSDLAAHTGNLAATGRAGVLLIEDESKTAQPFARQRIALKCRAAMLAKDAPRRSEVMDRFEREFGEVIRLIRPLEDFRVFALIPEEGVYVKGFGQAWRLDRVLLKSLCQDECREDDPPKRC